jgi:hypothetical protein
MSGPFLIGRRFCQARSAVNKEELRELIATEVQNIIKVACKAAVK